VLRWKGRRLAAVLAASCNCCIEPLAATAVNRRGFVAGVAAAGIAASGFAPKALAQAKPHRIDVHHHVSPPTWNAALRRDNAGQPPTYNWSLQKSLDDMDKSGVATSIASITTPGISFLGKDEAVRISRESNEYMARLMADHPGRFGLFATLPLPNIDETLKEIAYAFDTLKADGVCMMTSYDNKWLGHAHYAPVMEELNRRKAVVYTHPTSAACCTNLLPEFREPVVEYGTDTTRTIGSLVFSGASQKYRDLTFIFSHAGGTMPFLIERFTRLPRIDRRAASFTPEGVLAEFQRFYYDTAQAAHRAALSALTSVIPVSQIVYGTDFPFRTNEDHVRGLSAFFNLMDMKAIDRDNALRFIPRLKAA
jgi:predicted TIM-barrel fold metal-dependent hydrolase